VLAERLDDEGRLLGRLGGDLVLERGHAAPEQPVAHQVVVVENDRALLLLLRGGDE